MAHALLEAFVGWSEYLRRYELFNCVDVDLGTERIRLNGTTYKLDHTQVSILSCLLRAHGHSVTRRQMQEQCPALELEGRIDRHIGRLQQVCPELAELIVSSPAGYRLNLMR